MQMERLNNYPFVMFHGFAGFGEDELLTKVAPYFGMFSTDIKALFKKYDTEFYTPSMSGFSSMWDRACEMYAHIVGGTVDYGKVHSEKYGHARYGRTYKAIIPDWGQLDAEGKIKKINVVGHSFGGPTVRFFVNMMVVGCQEEIDGTPEEELSDFFKGGHANWIHSCTTLASANDGISFLYAIEKPAPKIAKGLLSFLSVLGNTPFARVYDPQLEHFGIMARPENAKFQFKVNTPEIEHYLASDDCVLNDLYVHKARERMAEWKAFDNIYYFSYSACCTKENADGHHVPLKRMIALLKPTAHIVGKYAGNPEDANHAYIDTSWRMNDGLVNTITEQAPKNERWEPWHGEDNIKPGIWYDMPVEEKDHMSYCGAGESREDYTIFFYEILKRVSNLPSIDL